MKTLEKLQIYRGKKIFLTGHTGFKGSWLAKWLLDLGAEVKGYALAPSTNPSHIKLLNLDIEEDISDIRDSVTLVKSIHKFKPDLVFHLAAQPLVRYSYLNPKETYETNVMGVLNLFEAVRGLDSVKAVVNVTTDKCYKNKEVLRGYTEEDEFGGYDPYSSSKACSEILTESYRNSFFNLEKYGKEHQCLIASARAGNVIGGGDWSEDRIIPDIIRSKTHNSKLVIRNPEAVRPWQHVLEPLSGYLTLGYHLLSGDKSFAEGWNFGPPVDQVFRVREVVEAANKIFEGSLNVQLGTSEVNPHEAGLLMLDPTKANERLGWRGVLDFKATIDMTFDWYHKFYEYKVLKTEEDIKFYSELLK